MEYFGLILILIAGILSPVQTGVNSLLREHVHTPVLSSTVSFTVGLLSLTILTLITCGGLIPSGEVISALPWWAWGGGLLGVIALTGNIILFPKLGGVLTVLIPMIGQIIASMLIDSFGWFGSTVIPMGTSRIAGLVLVLAGLMLYMLMKPRSKGAASGAGLLPWAMLGLLVGFAFATQPVLNGRLTTALGSSIHSACLSFLISTVILIAMVLVIPDERRSLASINVRGISWWKWIGGGLLGAYYVTVFALVTPIAGIGITALVGILGMILCSTVIDKKGLFGSEPQTIRPAQYVGLLIVFAGVVCIKML